AHVRANVGCRLVPCVRMLDRCARDGSKRYEDVELAQREAARRDGAANTKSTPNDTVPAKRNPGTDRRIQPLGALRHAATDQFVVRAARRGENRLPRIATVADEDAAPLRAEDFGRLLGETIQHDRYVAALHQCAR